MNSPAVPLPRPFKSCACGRTYTSESWRDLAYVGDSVDDIERLELRNCACGTTLSTPTVRIGVSYVVDRVLGGYVIFRRVGGREEPILFRGRWAVVPNLHQVEGILAAQRREDKRAAKRLGIELFDDDAE